MIAIITSNMKKQESTKHNKGVIKNRKMKLYRTIWKAAQNGFMTGRGTPKKKCMIPLLR